jgi:threonine/homoserine/homoserine lactone efflux protein
VGYEVLRWAGAAYLCWLGVRALWAARRRPPAPEPTAGERDEPERPLSRRDEPAQPPRPLAALRTGLATNLLNPKVGAFYLAVFPQFLPHGVPPVLGSVALAGVHIAEGLIWLGLVVLAVGRAGRWLTRPAVKRRLEQVTGAVLVAFGLRLVVDRH